MIEAQIYDHLVERGGWTGSRQVRIALHMRAPSVAKALTRLHARGAVERLGGYNWIKWRAIPNQVVNDRRESNGQYKRGEVKTAPEAPRIPARPIYPSALAQALEWHP